MRGTRLGRIDSDLKRRDDRALPAESVPLAGALVIALCASGCFSDRGVAIEIDIGTTGANSVELYIGKDGCNLDNHPASVKCGSIIPQGMTTPLMGSMWFRDAATRYTADVKGRTATFRLQAETTTKLPIVIAVGSVRDDPAMHSVATLRDLEIPLNSARIATATLVRADQVQPSGDGETRLVVWPKETSPSSCVAVENRRDQTVTWDFVVPFDDPDCDGLLNKNECNANAFEGTNAGGQAATPSCFAAGQAATCLLGSPACTDRDGPTAGTCAPQSPQHDQDPICVPSQFCTTACTSIGPECTQALIGGEVPRIECLVPVGLDGERCPGNHSTIDLNTFYSPNARCEQQPRLGSLQLAALLNNTSVPSFGGAIMKLGSPEAACSIPITWETGSRPKLDTMPEYGVLQLQTGARIALLPVVFHFELPGVCPITGQFACNIAGNQSVSDPLWTCAHSP